MRHCVVMGEENGISIFIFPTAYHTAESHIHLPNSLSHCGIRIFIFPIVYHPAESAYSSSQQSITLRNQHIHLPNSLITLRNQHIHLPNSLHPAESAYSSSQAILWTLTSNMIYTLRKTSLNDSAKSIRLFQFEQFVPFLDVQRISYPTIQSTKFVFRNIIQLCDNNVLGMRYHVGAFNPLPDDKF